MLQKEEYLGEVKNIFVSKDGKTARVIIPADSSNYRLYLFTSDGKGNVVCASEPLNLKIKAKNKE
ncbi:MAG: hypothetical protein M3Q58_07475 [Bacteroidota bacterium]|nr:hypothetical protein [Bacteroidota bacterium]